MQAGNSAGDEVSRSLRAAEEHRRKAARLEERAAAYARGRQGELAVALALNELAGDGYFRIDDCRWPGRARANIDHVLIGPAGLFVIDAKNWSGWVDVRAGVLRQNGYRRVREAQAAVEAADAVGSLLSARPSRLEGVICLCGEAKLSPTLLMPAGTVISAVDITEWVRCQPAVLSPAAVAAIDAELRRRLEPASMTGEVFGSSPIPDFVPKEWTAGPVRHEPAANARAGAFTRPSRRCTGHRFTGRQAVIGRALLLLLSLDAAGTAAFSTTDRTGGIVVLALCVAWLVRLERRRPVLISRRR